MADPSYIQITDSSNTEVKNLCHKKWYPDNLTPGTGTAHQACNHNGIIYQSKWSRAKLVLMDDYCDPVLMVMLIGGGQWPGDDTHSSAKQLFGKFYIKLEFGTSVC